MFKLRHNLIVLGAAIVILGSCKKDDPIIEPIVYDVPTTYNFTAADYTKSTQVLAMLSELTGYIRTTHVITEHDALDVQKLQNMYSNVNNQFADSALNSSGIQLKNKTGNAFNAQAELEANFLSAAAASVTASADPSNNTASDGVAGKLISGTRYILVDAGGFEYKEFVEKGIMGSVFYFQGTTILNTIHAFDNTTITAGTTAQERAWDEAFGLFGVPIDFPTNLVGLKNWGSYCNSVSKALAGETTLNQTIMNAWLKGRAAISNKDNAGRDAARDIVVKTWEKIGAARFITYVKGAKSKLGVEPSTVHHNLSEGVGFLEAFRYNSAKTISDADINLLLEYFKTDGKINLYNVTVEDLNSAIDKVATIFGLDSAVL